MPSSASALLAVVVVGMLGGRGKEEGEVRCVEAKPGLVLVRSGHGRKAAASSAVAVGAGVGAGGAGPGREEVLAELAEHRAGRRSVPQQPGRGHRRLHREVEVLGHRRAVHQLARTVQILHKNKKAILAICSYKKHSFEQLYGEVSKANCTSSSSSRNWLKIFKIKGFSIMETV